VGPTRPTMVVGRLAGGPNHLQSPFVASHMSSCKFPACLNFWYVSLMLHVGTLIHVSLNSAL